MQNNLIINESAYAGETSIVKKNQDTIEFIAIIQEADAVNRNGRIYPKSVLDKALHSPYVQERIDTKTFYCEAGHPLDTSVQRQMTIDQKNIACIIEEFWWEGNLLKARIETANTAVGRDMKGLIEQGSRVAFSLRAQGNVHKNQEGIIEVEDGLMICSFDWVVNPSHSKAFLEKICEATAYAIFKTSKNNLNSAILTESEDVFTNGLTYDPAEKVDEHELDYTKNYTPVYKTIADMYIPEEEDEVVSISEDVTIIRNGNTIKKVLTEDYLVKDIRSKLLNM